MLSPPLSAFSPAKCSGCSILLRYHLCCPARGGTGLSGGIGKPTLLGARHEEQQRAKSQRSAPAQAQEALEDGCLVGCS